MQTQSPTHTRTRTETETKTGTGAGTGTKTGTRHATEAVDDAAKIRRARFGALPEPIPYAAMVEEQPATPKAVDGYSEERSWLHYSCVALDLGF